MQFRLEKASFLWRTLRHGWFATLAVVVIALGGGVPGFPARAQSSRFQMTVNFSPQTPPLRPGVICKDQEYMIEVRPVIPVGEGIAPLPLVGGQILSTSLPQLGTLNGTVQPTSRIVGAGGPAVFKYKAERKGEENLNFGLVAFIFPGHQNNLTYDQIEDTNMVKLLTEMPFNFEVEECHYKVNMVVEWHYSQEIYLGATATMAETGLDIKPDGTLEGNGPFDFEYIASIAPCTADYSRFTVPVRLTGKLLNDTHELELTFDFGAASETADFTCQENQGMVARAQNISAIIGVKTATFPQDGAVKRFQIPGEGTGNLTVTVKPESSSTQK